jgi:hypothetical protein
MKERLNILKEKKYPCRECGTHDNLLVLGFFYVDKEGNVTDESIKNSVICDKCNDLLEFKSCKYNISNIIAHDYFFINKSYKNLLIIEHLKRMIIENKRYDCIGITKDYVKEISDEIEKILKGEYSTKC